MFKQLSILLAAFAFSLSAQAVSVDFTGQDWKDAISTSSDPTSATVGNVTLSTNYYNHYLNFNGSNSEISGCAAGADADIHDLTCLGDGIGIRRPWNNNDEISGSEQLLIEFAEAVDVTKIYLLDLFGAEKTGEKAIIINSNDVNKTVIGGDGTVGGFLSVEYILNEGNGLTSILLKGYRDCFSDFALAGLEIAPSPVPVPGAAILFGSALLGFFGFKRRRIA